MPAGTDVMSADDDVMPAGMHDVAAIEGCASDGAHFDRTPWQAGGVMSDELFDLSDLSDGGDGGGRGLLTALADEAGCGSLGTQQQGSQQRSSQQALFFFPSTLLFCLFRFTSRLSHIVSRDSFQVPSSVAASRQFHSLSSPFPSPPFAHPCLFPLIKSFGAGVLRYPAAAVTN